MLHTTGAGVSTPLLPPEHGADVGGQIIDAFEADTFRHVACVLPGCFVLAVIAIVGADLHFRATGQENWAPLLFFVGFLGVIVIATLVYSCLQHSAALEAATTAERLARYRASAHGSAARALHVPYVSYDARTLTARGTPLYGGFDAAEGAIYTATVVAPAHAFAPLAQRYGHAPGTAAEMQPRYGGGAAAPESPQARSPSYGAAAAQSQSQAPRMPSVISVGPDGVSAGVPAYPEHAGTPPPQVIPAFRWEPLRPLPGGAAWVPATTAVGGHGAVPPAGGASIGGWGASGAPGGAGGRATPAAAARAAREAPPQPPRRDDEQSQPPPPPLASLAGLPALRATAAPAADASRRQWRTSSGGGAGGSAAL